MAALETRLLVFSLRRTGGRLHLVVPTLGRIPIGRAPLTGYWERGDLVLRIPGRPRLVFTPSQSGFLSACQAESDRTVILVNHHGRFRIAVMVTPLAENAPYALGPPNVLPPTVDGDIGRVARSSVSGRRGTLMTPTSLTSVRRRSSVVQ